MRFAILVILLLSAFLLTIFQGTADISFYDVFRILFGEIWSDNSPHLSNSAEWRIVWDFRLPRAFAAVFAGASLSLSGLLLQSVFRNPLAGPFVLGISSGASLGVALLLLAGWGFGSFGFLSAASLGAGAAVAFIIAFSKFVRGNAGLLVLGLMIGYFTDAIVSILMYSGNSEALRGFISWGFGSFGRLPRHLRDL